METRTLDPPVPGRVRIPGQTEEAQRAHGLFQFILNIGVWHKAFREFVLIFSWSAPFDGGGYWFSKAFTNLSLPGGPFFGMAFAAAINAGRVFPDLSYRSAKKESSA